IEIHHIQGKANGRADALSRRPDYDKGTNDNDNVVVLPNKLFVRKVTVDECIRAGRNTIAAIPEPQSKLQYDEQNENILKPWVNAHRLKEIEGVWYKDGRRVVTGGLTAKQKLIRNHHDPPVYGHPGIRRTIDLVQRQYWWPKLQTDVLQYIKGCAECQWMKVNTQPMKVPLQPIYAKPEATPFE